MNWNLKCCSFTLRLWANYTLIYSVWQLIAIQVSIGWHGSSIFVNIHSKQYKDNLLSKYYIMVLGFKRKTFIFCKIIFIITEKKNIIFCKSFNFFNLFNWWWLKYFLSIKCCSIIKFCLKMLFIDWNSLLAIWRLFDKLPTSRRWEPS